MGATATAAIIPSDSVQAQAKSQNKGCPSGKILTLKPWYDGLLDSDCSVKSPDKLASSGKNDGLSKFIWRVVLNIVDDMLQLTGFITVGFIIYGGFVYMTSSGSPDKAAKGKKTVIYAVVGLVIAIGSTLLVNLVAIRGLGL
ncbi:hypothetical protein CR969_02105 [Candidatus Saccharibacteria bacterium]|nr:MAG: hypothetical protein CR969_02105 [Candidatus Saccharibacteria bacterium]